MSPSKKTFLLDGHTFTTRALCDIIANQTTVAISPKTAKNIEDSHSLLHKFVKEDRVIYGVNTSLGGFVNWMIPIANARELQENLIAAVSTNVGPYLEDEIVKASMLARLNSLARGTSAISSKNFNKLLAMYNKGVIPCIPSKGSLGASGDLGPLGCIALVAIGKWKAKYKNKELPGLEALKQAGIEPMELGYKEGLSLINGTSVMVGVAATLLEKAIQLIRLYDVISCLTFETLKAKKKPFNPVVHKQKPHPGQLRTAENIWKLLSDSKMIVDEKTIEKELQEYRGSKPTSTNIPIEDSYSVRCSPHIIGPIRDSLRWIQTVVNSELNSSNDNPLILPKENEVFHNGHFHGQYISMAMDHLSIGLTTLSNLSDRRIDRFMDKNHSNNLPPFLCAENPGLRLGLMGGQFMATSLTSENRSLCNPVSIQTLTSTGDFQDIVSLGLVAARRAKEIYENTVYVLTFELLCGAQAADIRDSKFLSKATKTLFANVREIVPYLSSDVCITDYLESIAADIKSGKFLQNIENEVGEIPF